MQPREVIEHGSRRAAELDRWSERARALARRHRRALRVGIAGLALLVVAAGGLGYLAGRPRLPDRVSLSGQPATGWPAARTGLTWPVGQDGRPAGNVRLEGRVSLTFHPPTRATRTQVLGLAGPGALRPIEPAISVPTGTTSVSADLSVEVNCARLSTPVRRDSYGLLVRAVEGDRTRDGVLPLNGDAPGWSAAVQHACAAWRARRDVTVTAIETTVDPVRPSVLADLTLANAGDQVVIARPAAAATFPVTPLTPLPAIPAHGRAAVRLRVDVADCGLATDDLAWAEPEDPADTAAALRLGLAITQQAPGQSPPDPGRSVQPEAPEAAYTLPVLAPTVLATLVAALHTACGGLSPVVAIVPPGGVHYQAAGGRLTVRTQLYLSPGRVQSVHLVPQPGTAGFDFTPTWGPNDWLSPDRSGLLTLTLTYGAAAGQCPREPAVPPLHLDVRTGPRTLSFDGIALDLFEDPAEPPVLPC